jgi:hypothetical protein
MAAKAAPTFVAPLTSTFFIATFAASSCAGITIIQTHSNNPGSAWPLTTRNKAVMRRIMRLPVNSTNGAVAAQINHHRGTLMCASRIHCSAA